MGLGPESTGLRGTGYRVGELQWHRSTLPWYTFNTLMRTLKNGVNMGDGSWKLKKSNDPQ